MPSPMLTMLRAHRELRRNAKLTRPQLEAKKLERFRALVRKIGQTSPYYAEVIREHGIDPDICTPADFPVMTKPILMENFDRIFADPRISRKAVAEFFERSREPAELFLDEYKVIETSGTSGEPGFYVYSRSEWSRAMAQALRAGYRNQRLRRVGRFRVAYFAAVDGHYGGVTMVDWWKQTIARFLVDYRHFEVNRPLAESVAQINAFQPDAIIGYTKAVRMLAEEQVRGSLHIDPIGVTVGGEMVTEDDVATLKRVFDCDVINLYGSCEHLYMGYAHSDEARMTLYDDDVIYEVADDQIVTTNLLRETMPLIRYSMSDRLELAPQSSTSPYLEVNQLIGRAEMWVPFINQKGERDFVSPQTVISIIANGVSRTQMRVLDETSFTFLVSIDKSLTAGEREEAVASIDLQIRRILDQKLMSNLRWEIIPVDDIPVDPRTRKFRLIVPPGSHAANAEPVMDGSAR